MVVELGSEYAVFAQTTNHICANAEYVFVQPWRAVFAHSSPHCPLTPCQRLNTNIEQAKNEKKFNSCSLQEAIHPLKFVEHLLRTISGKELWNIWQNRILLSTYLISWQRQGIYSESTGMGSTEIVQFYLYFKFTSSLINSLHNIQGQIGLERSANWSLIPIHGPRGSRGKTRQEVLADLKTGEICVALFISRIGMS